MKSVPDQALSVAANKGVIDYLRILNQGAGMVHPDITEWLHQLKSRTKGICLRKLYRSQVLVDTDVHLIRVVAFGTGYAVKVFDHLNTLISLGKEQEIQWSDGTVLNTSRQFGPDWIVGSFDALEAIWISEKISGEAQQVAGGDATR